MPPPPPPKRCRRCVQAKARHVNTSLHRGLSVLHTFSIRVCVLCQRCVCSRPGRPTTRSGARKHKERGDVYRSERKQSLRLSGVFLPRAITPPRGARGPEQPGPDSRTIQSDFMVRHSSQYREGPTATILGLRTTPPFRGHDRQAPASHGRQTTHSPAEILTPLAICVSRTAV